MFDVKNWYRCAALALIVTALALAGCGKKAEPTKAEAEPKSADPKGTPVPPEPKPAEPKPPTPTPPDAKPDFVLDPSTLSAEFKTDIKAATAKYKGKIIELSGVVGDYGNAGAAIGGGPFLSIGKQLGDQEIVPCWTVEQEPWKKAMPGQSVRVRGTLWEEAPLGGLFKCHILDVSGSPLPTIAIEQLAKEYAADPKSADKKYYKKFVVLTASVAKITPNENTPILVFVDFWETTGKLRFVDAMRDHNLAGKQVGDLKVGQKVKMLAQIGTGPSLSNSMVLEYLP